MGLADPLFGHIAWRGYAIETSELAAGSIVFGVLSYFMLLSVHRHDDVFAPGEKTSLKSRLWIAVPCFLLGALSLYRLVSPYSDPVELTSRITLILLGSAATATSLWFIFVKWVKFNVHARRHADGMAVQ